MNNSTMLLASQLPVFKTRGICELQDYQELLKLLQKYHIQKFLLKSKSQIYDYLQSQCQNIGVSSDEDSSFQENDSDDQSNPITQNKVNQKQDKLKHQQQQMLYKQYAEIQEEQERNSTQFQESGQAKSEKNQLLENLKTLPQIQDFDEEDIKSMLNDLYQDETRHRKQNGQTKNYMKETNRDETQYKWPASRVKIQKALTIMVQKKIPYARVLQDFKISYKTYSYSLFIKDSEDTANLMWQKIKDNGCDTPNVQYRVSQIELLLDMVKLVYERRELCRDQIVAICSGTIFQKKLKALKEKAEQKVKCDDQKCVQITGYLDRINDFVLQGPMLNKYVNGSSECQYLQQKILKKASKSLLYQTVLMGVPVPEILSFLSLRKSRYNNSLVQQEQNQGIYILPSIDLLKIIAIKPGMESIACQLRIEELDSNLDLKQLNEFNFDISNGLMKLEKNGVNILYQVLQLILVKLDQLDHFALKYIVEDRRYTQLQFKLNEMYKEEIQQSPNNEQEIPLYLGCVMNKIELYVRQYKRKPIKQQPNICCIKIKQLLDSNIILTNEQKALSDEQLEQCKNLFLLFLQDISNKEIAFPECLSLFKIIEGKFILQFETKIIGVMLLSKSIRQYFATCMGMDPDFDKQINGQTIFINSVPLLDIEIANKQLPDLSKVFCSQVHLLFDYKELLKQEVKEMFMSNSILEILQQMPSLQDDECAESLAELKQLQQLVISEIK